MTIRRLLLAAVSAAAIAPAGAQGTAARADLLLIVGLWRAQGDTVITDGASWNGESSREIVSRGAAQLFGTATGGFVANATSAGAFPLAVYPGVSSFTSGTLRVRFKLVSGPTDQSAGIVFGLGADGAYRFLRYNTKDGNLALWGFAAGERQVIAKGEGLEQLPLGAWHELVVRIQGRQLTASVTGHPTLDVTFTLDTPVQGRIGLWAKRDVVTAFHGLSATASNR